MYMALSKEKQQELFTKFLDKLLNNEYDELPVILAEFQSLSVEDYQAYNDFLTNIGINLIDIIKDKYENGGENGLMDAIDILNKLEKCGINDKVLLPNYSQHQLILEIRELKNLLQFEGSQIEQPLTFTNRSTIQDLANESLELICKEIEKLLGTSGERELYPKQAIQLLQTIKQADPSKFQHLISFDKGWEGNTLLLTALSLEHLDVAEYLLNNQANIDINNEFGMNPIHMLAMVHIDSNKHVRDNSGIESTITIDHIPQIAFSDQQILERLRQVQSILNLMKQNNPTYFANNINQPKTLHSTAYSSTPLTKVIAYNRKANHLEVIVNLWRQFEANIPNSVSIARFVLGSYDFDFILKVNELFPNSFTPVALNQKREDETIIKDFIVSSSASQMQIYLAIIAIKKINNNSNEIMDCIKNAFNNMLPRLVRNEILGIISDSSMEYVFNNPQNFLQKLDECKDWLRLTAIYDENINSKPAVLKFLEQKISSVQNFNPQSSNESNKLIIIAKLEDIKEYLKLAPRTNEDEEILRKYSSTCNYWKPM